LCEKTANALLFLGIFSFLISSLPGQVRAVLETEVAKTFEQGSAPVLADEAEERKPSAR